MNRVVLKMQSYTVLIQVNCRQKSSIPFVQLKSKAKRYVFIPTWTVIAENAETKGTNHITLSDIGFIL